MTVFFLVPPFLVHWDRRPWPQRGSGMNGWAASPSRLTLTSMRHPKTMVVVWRRSCWRRFRWSQQVKVESDLLTFFSPDHPVNRHTQLIESKLAGVTSLEISLVGDGRDSLQNVATLRAMRDFQPGSKSCRRWTAASRWSTWWSRCTGR